MATIYLVRHGQASFGAEDYDKLSELGYQQAEVLGKSLENRLGQHVELVFGSMLRHKQTLEKVASSAGWSISGARVDSRWNEYDHQQLLGKLDDRFTTASGVKNWLRTQANPGKALSDLFGRATKRWQSGEYDQQYSESWLDFKDRVAAALSDVTTDEKKQKTVVVFTSGGPIATIVLALLKVDDCKLMETNWTLVNAGLTKIVKTKSGMFLSSFNEHCHLDNPHTQHLLTYK